MKSDKTCRQYSCDTNRCASRISFIPSYSYCSFVQKIQDLRFHLLLNMKTHPERHSSGGVTLIIQCRHQERPRRNVRKIRTWTILIMKTQKNIWGIRDRPEVAFLAPFSSRFWAKIRVSENPVPGTHRPPRSISRRLRCIPDGLQSSR